jgi:hypothetical protein
VSAHITEKLNNSVYVDWAQKIDNTMNSQGTIWISYEGGSTPGESRPIKPLRWLQKPKSFVANSLRHGDDTSLEKKYLLLRISALDSQ